MRVGIKAIVSRPASGFGLAEAFFALMVVAVVAGYQYPRLQDYIRHRAVDVTVGKAAVLGQLGQNYFKRHGRWPDSLEALLSYDGNSGHFENRNGFGLAYEWAAPRDGRMVVKTRLPDADSARAVKSLSPFEALDGEETGDVYFKFASSAPSGSADPQDFISLTRPKPLRGDLYLNGNPILGLSAINSDRKGRYVLTQRDNPRNSQLVVDAIFAREVVTHYPFVHFHSGLVTFWPNPFYNYIFGL